jgi:ZIP family zinc transporter
MPLVCDRSIVGTVTTTAVFVTALVTAVATGLGALPFAFRGPDLRRWLGSANAVASGVMLGASASLLLEGVDRSGGSTLLGIVAGAAFVAFAYRVIGDRNDLHLGTLRGADARKALLVLGVMTAHSAAEGIGIGSAFGDTTSFGLLIAFAIAVQNIPEGLAISLVLVPRGTTVARAAAWSVFSSLPQPLLAVPAFLFVEEFTALLPAALGFGAGAMVWMVGRDLLPEAFRQGPRQAVVTNAAIAFVLMLALQLKLAA